MIDWQGFRNYLNDNINLKTPLNSQDDVENTSEYITCLIQLSASKNTLNLCCLPEILPQSNEIEDKLRENQCFGRI